MNKRDLVAVVTVMLFFINFLPLALVALTKDEWQSGWYILLGILDFFWGAYIADTNNL